MAAQQATEVITIPINTINFGYQADEHQETAIDNYEEEDDFDGALEMIKESFNNFRFKGEVDPLDWPLEEMFCLLGHLGNLKESLQNPDDFETTRSVLTDLVTEYPELNAPDILIRSSRDPKVFFSLPHLAIFSSKMELFNTFISLGGDPFIRDSSGNTPFEYAFTEKFIPAAHWIIIKVPQVITQPFLNCPSFIHYAVWKDDVKILKSLRSKHNFNFSTPIPGAIEESPLELALRLGKKASANYLLENNAFHSIENIAKIYLESFSYALQSNHEIPLLICHHFPEIRYTKTPRGQDILLSILEYGLEDLVRELFKAGFDPNLVDYDLLDELSRFSVSSETYKIIVDQVISQEYCLDASDASEEDEFIDLENDQIEK